MLPATAEEREKVQTLSPALALSRSGGGVNAPLSLDITIVTQSYQFVNSIFLA